MLPGGGSFQSANVRILISRRGSGITFGAFFVSVARLGICSRRSIVAALIDKILQRISASSLRCPLRSSAGRRMGKSALRRKLPIGQSERPGRPRHRATGVGGFAGASAPEVLIERVIDRLAEWRDIDVSTLAGREERIQFRLPAELVEG